MKTVIIDPRFIRPLPKAQFRCACDKCDKLQAMWELGEDRAPDRIRVCSLCFLYESEWGKAREVSIFDLVQEVERAVGQSFLRAEDGRKLLHARDGDRVLGAVALTSRMFAVQAAVDKVRAQGSGRPS